MAECDYHNEIVMSPENTPLFRVSYLDVDGLRRIEEASTTTGAWQPIMEKIAVITNRKQATISGPVQFGLADAVVRQLIQQLPNANSCHSYVMEDRKPTITLFITSAHDSPLHPDECGQLAPCFYPYQKNTSPGCSPFAEFGAHSTNSQSRERQSENMPTQNKRFETLDVYNLSLYFSIFSSIEGALSLILLSFFRVFVSV